MGMQRNIAGCIIDVLAAHTRKKAETTTHHVLLRKFKVEKRKNCMSKNYDYNGLRRILTVS